MIYVFKSFQEKMSTMKETETRPRWRYLTPDEIESMKDVQRRTFHDRTFAREDGIAQAEDGSLCGVGRPVRIEAGSIEEFAKAFDEAFFKD